MKSTRQYPECTRCGVFPRILSNLFIASLLLLFGAGSRSALAFVAGSSDSLLLQVELFEDMGAEAESPDEKKVVAVNLSDAVGVDQESLNDDAVELSLNDTTEPNGEQRIRPVSLNQIPDHVYRARAFGFHRLPFKYDETGVRELHKGPIILRATARLTLEKGEHRILIRTRDDASFRMDGELLTTVKVLQIPSDGHNPMRKIPERVAPTIKDFAPGNTEQVFSLIADGLPHTFTLETVVGRSDRRPDLGVLAVAIAGPGEDSFTLLGSDKKSDFSNAGWADFVKEEEACYRVMDAQERHARSTKETQYWQQRHDYAKHWLNDQDPVVLPAVGKLIPVHNAIDHFIGRRIEEAALHRIARDSAERDARAKGLVLFQTDIQPILEDNCLKCHADKEKGELRLDSRERALLGGESDEPAIVPGHAEESLLIEMLTLEDMPPKGRLLNEKEIDLLSRWIKQGAQWDEFEQETIAASRHPSATELKSSQLSPLPLSDDLAFLRRVTLDTVGLIPTLEEIKSFQADKASNKRSKVIDRLLNDPRWADHWVPFWQDILAENPNIVKPNLNNTGAFRWWIHESFMDNKPMDRFVTDLILMRGDKYIGPAGFGMATQNDVPMAAKAHILGGAFMGVQMRCARCHDAPFQSVLQEDLFNLAAMLERKPIKVPASSIVPVDKLAGRKALVKVSLKPDDKIDPVWPFNHFSNSPLPGSLIRDPDDPRESLAAHITSPSNSRFAKAIVNWAWKRYFGKGLIEPAIDWENADISHPDLLAFLAKELVGHDYDIKHVCRLILNSHTYQREVFRKSDAQAAALFAGHSRRRMTAEQILDSLHLATDRQIDSEELNMDQDGRRPIKQFINLGTPQRAWEFTSLSNERDRPSLTLPHAQVYVDVLEAYGWNGSRQNPIHNRDHEMNVLQPAALANGIMSQRLTRLSDDHPLTELVMETRGVGELVDILFLKTLGRPPGKNEKRTYTSLLRDGYDHRIIPESEWSPAPEPHRYPYVTWSNHLKSEASDVKNSIARDIEAGEPPTRYLRTAWRKNLEDGLWALINSPEMIFIP
ncbi:MAG: DUF1553 domain-containing protein [Verrucomicrobia bacterium]|nr:DUF1553 domain-containing protein [Verrucomicrobiota bacterium]